MNVLNESLNDDFDCNSYLDELDIFDEFDLECISKDYDGKERYKFIVQDVEEIIGSLS